MLNKDRSNSLTLAGRGQSKSPVINFPPGEFIFFLDLMRLLFLQSHLDIKPRVFTCGGWSKSKTPQTIQLTNSANTNTPSEFEISIPKSPGTTHGTKAALLSGARELPARQRDAEG